MGDSSSISNFCKSLGSFCKHLQSSSEALKESVERRPIPLDSASTTFINCLNRRVTSASNDLNMLESMAFGTVSFEELLGHCNELYKKNETDLLEIEDRFMDFGYVPEVEIEDEVEDVGLKTPTGVDSKLFSSTKDGLDFSCGRGSIMKRIEEDPIFNESLSLQSLGLSDVCLATLASEGSSTISKDEYDILFSFSKDSATKAVIHLSKDDYEILPSFMKNLASWEELNVAVDKMNSFLSSQEKSKEQNVLHQDKLASLGLGPKVRSYLLMLLRMHRLVVETVDGSVVYRVL